MPRTLRVIPQTPVAKPLAANGIFVCVVFCLLLQCFAGNNVVRAIVGHDVNIRFNPANIIMLFCAGYAMIRGVIPFHRRCHDAPGLMIFFFAVPTFAAYTVYFNGFSGAAFYFDSFWGPALLAVALQSATPKQRRFLAKMFLAIVIFNVLFALYESVTQENIFPFVASDDITEAESKVQQLTTDFRANAFYTHPLTASLVTAMGFFLLYRMRLRFIFAAPTFMLLLVGMLSFGGRTALAVTIMASAYATIYLVIIGILRKNIQLSLVVYVVTAIIVTPLFVGFIVTQTTIAERIIDTLYVDDSAKVRITQWMVLNYLTLKEWLFGVPLQHLMELKYQIGLNDIEDIENFWLLLFLNLGAVGFVAFLVVLGLFLAYIARVGGGLFGWLLMLSALVIDSGSNSLGQKSNDLVMEVAFLVAMSGYSPYVRKPVYAQRLRMMRVRTQTVLGHLQAPIFSRGLSPSPRRQ